MMADLHVNDRRFLQLTKAFSMLGGEVLSNIKIFFFASGCLSDGGTANLYEEAKREGGGKEDLDSIKATCQSPTYLSLSYLPFFFPSSSSLSFSVIEAIPP